MMKTIVIAEDEYRTRQGLSKLIQKLNSEFCVVGEAEDGLEGLKMIQSLTPDIVITDIRMPKITGLDMIEQVRKMNIECKFVILSGYADFSYAQQAIHLGVEDYLLKPITISMVKDLLDKLQEHADKEEPSVCSNECYSAIVRKAVEEIHRHYSQQIRLESFAEENNITPQYMSSLFSKETGTTFSNYLRDVRIEKAKELLKEGNQKVYEIACAVGYPDQKYFSKIFRECVGVSAKQYAMNAEEQ